MQPSGGVQKLWQLARIHVMEGGCLHVTTGRNTAPCLHQLRAVLLTQCFDLSAQRKQASSAAQLPSSSSIMQNNDASRCRMIYHSANRQQQPTEGNVNMHMFSVTQPQLGRPYNTNFDMGHPVMVTERVGWLECSTGRCTSDAHSMSANRRLQVWQPLLYWWCRVCSQAPHEHSNHHGSSILSKICY